MFSFYEVYECPEKPTERGRYIGASPVYDQAAQAVERHNAEYRHGKARSAWFLKGVLPNGDRVVFL